MKRFLCMFVMVILAAGLMGCGAAGSTNQAETNDGSKADGSAISSDSANAESNAEDDGVSKESTAQQGEYPLTVTDATGKEFTFTEAPERIVSTSPAETEILFALGLGDKVVGVSDFDNYPEEVNQKPRIGGIVKPNEEAIMAANPDLVIVGGSMKVAVVEKLRGFQLNVFKQEPKNIEGILNEIVTLGKVTGKVTESEALVAKMREDIRKVSEAAAKLKPEEKKRVYIEFSPGWTVGKGEFMDELITMAGGINIASDMEGWNAINEEKIVQDNPDVILYTLNVKDEKSGQSLDQIIKDRSGWNKIKAIQEDRLVGLDADILSRPGPRMTQALLQISEAIYPGLVNP